MNKYKLLYYEGQFKGIEFEAENDKEALTKAVDIKLNKKIRQKCGISRWSEDVLNVPNWTYGNWIPLFGAEVKGLE